MTIAEALDHLKLNNTPVMDLVQCHTHTYVLDIIYFYYYYLNAEFVGLVFLICFFLLVIVVSVLLLQLLITPLEY